MSFESFAEAQSFLLWSTFVVALIMGAVVNKTNFCTMGAVSDVVNIGDYGRMRAWLLAIGVALVGMLILEPMGLVQPNDAFPPYRGGQLLLGENIIGGLLFGIGMTLGSGCGNKCLVRFGGGNIKSIFVFLVIGVIAYFMVNPFPGSDQTLFTVLFYDWIRPLSVNVGAYQDLGTVVAGPENAMNARLVIGGLIAAVILWFVFKSREFRSSADNVLGGLVVGLAVLAAWYITSNIVVGDDGLTLRAFVQDWGFNANPDDGVKPADSRPLSPQSFTFINPMGQTVGWVASGFPSNLLTFGIMAFTGVVAGSLLWAILSRSFRFEWFNDTRDFMTHVIGAILMGFGGVLAMGCTVGQAITGVSTLAIGSFLTFGSIVLGSALTMKVQYYKMVYEDEATFGKALITGLVDLKLLPAGMRKLEAI